MYYTVIHFGISTFFFSDPQEFMHYGSIPMQSYHMKQNYAVYLSNNFPMVIILVSQCFGCFLLNV